MAELERVIRRFENISSLANKLGEITYYAVLEEDNFPEKIGEAIASLVSSCELERDYDIINKVIVAICGYSIPTLLDRIVECDKDRDWEWDTIGLEQYLGSFSGSEQDEEDEENEEDDEEE